jgi:hypothetical protein
MWLFPAQEKGRIPTRQSGSKKSNELLVLPDEMEKNVRTNQNSGPCSRSIKHSIGALRCGRSHDGHLETERSQDRVDAQGKAGTGEFTVKFDGKDYPISGDPYVDRLSLKRVSQYEVDGIGKKNDKTATTFQWVVSQDGKLLTYTTQRLYPPDRVGTIIQILDKQE